MKIFIKSFILALVLGLLSALPIHAQEVSFALTPSTQEIVSRSGQSITLSYVLSNLGDPQQVAVKVVSLIPQADGTMQISSKLEGPLQVDLLNDDIQLAQPFFMRGNTKKILNVSIQIPQVVQEKDYYIGLVVQAQAPPTNEGTITARAQLGVVSSLAISVTSDGSLDTKPRVVTFRLNTKNQVDFFGKKFYLVQTGQRVPLVLEISNQGRHLIQAQGVVSVKGLGPKKNLVIMAQAILAGSQSILSVADNTLSGFFFGPYTISATVNFGPSSPIIYATTQVFAVPSLPILMIIIALILLLGFRLYSRRRL